MAAHYNHCKLVTLLLDNKAELFDDENSQNPLDVAVADNNASCALAIISHDRWDEALKPMSMDTKIQLREMVIKMPNVALVTFDISLLMIDVGDSVVVVGDRLFLTDV